LSVAALRLDKFPMTARVFRLAGAILLETFTSCAAPFAATGPATPKAQPSGLVLAAKIVGDVTVTFENRRVALKVDDRVPPGAVVNTGREASAALVCSNGVVLSLGAETELKLGAFAQEPFANTFAVASLVIEPSTSQTKLRLNQGELVLKVLPLRYADGSTFLVETPVGVAKLETGSLVGRLVFRAQGTGKALFEMSSAAGEWTFQPPGGSRTIVKEGAEHRLTVTISAKSP
jgi:hypothetical protein